MKTLLKRFLALVLTMALTLTLVPTSFAAQPTARPITAEQYAEIDLLWDEISDLETRAMQRNSTDSVACVNIASVAKKVQASDLYVDGSLQWHGDSYFTFATTSGVVCGYNLRLRQQIRDAENAKVEDAPEMPALRGGMSSSKKVYVIQPYYGVDSSFTTQYYTEGQKIAKAIDGECILYRRNDATIDAVAEAISNGAVTIFDSHGATDYEYGDDCVTRATTSYLCLQTGTGLTSADYANGSAVYDGSYNKMNYYMVNGTCIANHMKTDSPNGLLWMAICLGMATDGLHKPLLARGVDTAYGYSQPVSFDGDYMYEAVFWDEMRKGATVSTAIAAMKKKLGNWDPAYAEYSYERARREYIAFPIVVSKEDVYPGHGKVDTYQTVNSQWLLTGTSYKLNLVVNDPSMGSATLNGSNLTVNPKEGHYVKDISISPVNAATLISNGENTYYLSNVKSDCTITVTFAAKTATIVHFSTPDGVVQADMPIYIGDNIVLPAPSGSPINVDTPHRFLGWTKVGIRDTATLPQYLPAGSVLTIEDANTTFYALYTYRMPLDGKTGYYLVSSSRADWSGEYVICANNSVQLSADGSFTGSSLATLGATDFASAGLLLVGNELQNVSSSHLYIFESASNSTYSIRMAESENYLALTTNSNSLTTVSNANAKTAQWTISYSNGQIHIFNAFYTARRLQYNNGEFRCYSSAKEPVQLFGMSESIPHYTTTPTPSAHKHSYTPEVIAPTCEKNGYTIYRCLCGNSYQDNTTAALGHDDRKDVVEPTCLKDGKTVLFCTRCGRTETVDTIPALGHNDNEKLVEPTCLEDGKTILTCTRCGRTETTNIIPALGHDDTEKFEEPTCLEVGKTVLTCARCGRTETISTVPPLGHDDRTENVKPTCLEGGKSILTCTRCGRSETIDTAPALGHDLGEWIVVREAAPHSEGLQIQSCSRCDLRNERIIDALPCPSVQFSDVKQTHWYHTAVDFVVHKGLFSGTSTTTFEPNAPTTRAMLVSVLWRLSGAPEGAKDAGFADVKSKYWFADAVNWAYANSIVNGTTTTTFSPNNSITREQVASILYRYASFRSMDTTARASLDGFGDSGKVAAYAVEALSWAVGKGIISGTTGNLLAPRGEATRAEIAQMMMKFMQ